MKKPGLGRKSVIKKSNSLRQAGGKAAARVSKSRSPQSGKFQVAVAKSGRVLSEGSRRDPEVLNEVISGNAPFWTINALSPIQRSEIVEEGVPAGLLTRLADTLHVSQERLYTTIGVSRATASRALRGERALSASDSEHAMGLARLVGQVEQIVKESGNPQGFDAGKWMAAFLETEQASLGGRRPAELMRTSDGRSVVATLISQMQSGAYA